MKENKAASFNAIYPILDIEITLRCNGGCKNCIKFCGLDKMTGIPHKNLDMTMEQIQKFITQVKDIGDRTGNLVCGNVFITGGEPLLHRNVVEITQLIQNELVPKYINELYVNTNLTLKIPKEIEPFAINFSTPKQNALIHDTAFIHPDDGRQKRQNFKACTHYRKHNVVLNYHGYSVCCAGDGYIRLFGKENLILDTLPDTIKGFPLNEMDEICQHCPFGVKVQFPERDFGSPISNIYKEEAKKNKVEYRIKKIF